MAVDHDKFIMVNQERDSGIILEEYNGKFSLTAGYINKKGEPAISWCFRQDYNKELQESVPGKSIPIKIELGTKEEAVKHLTALLDMLDPDGTLRVPF